MEKITHLQQQVLRGWCEELTKHFDANHEDAYEHCLYQVKGLLGGLEKEEQQAIFKMDKDLKTFVNSFGALKILVK